MQSGRLTWPDKAEPVAAVTAVASSSQFSEGADAGAVQWVSNLRVGGRAAGAGMLADYTTAAVPVFDETGTGRTPTRLKVRACGLTAVIDSTVLSDVFGCNAARSSDCANRCRLWVRIRRRWECRRGRSSGRDSG